MEKELQRHFEDWFKVRKNHYCIGYDDRLVFVEFHPGFTVVMVEVCSFDELSSKVHFTVKQLEDKLNRRFKEKVVIDYSRIMLQNILYSEKDMKELKRCIKFMSKRAKRYQKRLLKQ